MNIKLTLFLFFTCVVMAFAQPQISYMIPDIGAPGMNTYVEFVAPASATQYTGGFGPPGIYPNVPTSVVRVRCQNAADEQKITISPCVVSWDGRLVSAQIFVNPSLVANETDWQLTPHVIPIVVETFFTIYTGVSNAVNFYVVKPTHIGDIRVSNEYVLGAGNLGKRSPRGAMIVDSIFFRSGPGIKYTVSTADCDPNTPGNQGYLPFVLLAQNRIEASSTTVLSVSASTSGPNAGPGGGGGGGIFHDLTLPANSAGGAGFTGGGPGGCDNGDQYGTGGAATSLSQVNYTYGFSSMNGVPGGTTSGAWENSGGGTGHPFGTSGIGCNNYSTCNPEGGYGGGSGGKQTGTVNGYGFRGGDGANAIAGIGEAYNPTQGGKVVGNRMGVPLAGGSGGASGNAYGLSNSGYGGGGGGAIRVSAPIMLGFEVQAVGGLGSSPGSNAPLPSSGAGGCGSGGYVELNSKDSMNVMTVNVRGGNYDVNNYGRIRVNYSYSPNQSQEPNKNPDLPAVQEYYYRGITTKSYKTVPRTFTLEGTYDINRVVHIYIKPESGNWYYEGNISASSNPNVRTWSKSITLAGTDLTYYLVALEEQTTVIPSGQYTSVPAFTFSQAAANVLKIASSQITKENASLHALPCEATPNNFQMKKVVSINAVGTQTTTFNRSQNYFKYGNRGFSVNYLDNDNVQPGNSYRIEVTFSYDKGFGIVPEMLDTLFVYHNGDNLPNPVGIELKAILDQLPFEVRSRDMTQIITSIDFPMSCNTVANTKYFKVKNITDRPITIQNLFLGSSQLAASWPDISIPIPPGGNKEIQVNFTPSSYTPLNTYLRILFAECDTIYHALQVTGSVYNPTIDVPAEFDLGVTCSGQTLEKTMTVTNTSSENISLVTGTFSNNIGFSAAVIPPGSMVPGGTAQIKFTLAPGADGTYETFYTFSSALCPQPEFRVKVKGRIREFKTDLGKTTVTVPPICVNTIKDTVFTFTNTGLDQFTIDNAPGNITSDNPSFVPVVLTSGPVLPGSEFQIGVQINITTPGPQIGTIRFQFRDCPGVWESFVIQASSIDGSYSVSKNRDFGNVVLGETDVIIFTITNTGTNESLIDNILPLAPPFSIQKVEPAGVTSLMPGESINVFVTFTPTDEFDHIGTLEANFLLQPSDCNNKVTQTFHARGIKSDIVINPNPVDFGIVANCEGPKAQNVTITNKSDAPFSLINPPDIGGADKMFYSVSSSVSYPHELKKNEFATYTVTFTPIAGEPLGVKNASLTFYTDMTLVSTIDVPLVAIKDTVALEYQSPLVIPDVLVNTSNSGTVTFTNPTLRDAGIASVSSNSANVTVSPSKGTVGKGSSEFDFTVNAYGATLGPQTATLTFHAATPCDIDYTVEVHYNVVEGSITADHDAKCDTVFYCETHRDSIILYNPSNYTVSYSDIRFDGANASNYSFDATPSARTLDPRQSDTIRFSVSIGTGEPLGLKSAEFVAKTSLIAMPELRVPLTTFFQGFNTTISPLVINLPARNLSSTEVVPVMFTNSTGREEVVQTPNGIVYSASNITSDPLASVPAWGNATINVSYTYLDVGFKSDSIKVYFDTPCRDSIVILINATGIDASFEYTNMADFQLVTDCKTPDMPLVFTNRNPIGEDIEILDMKIEGPDASYFSFVNTITYPIVLPLGVPHTEPVRFTAAAGPDGVKTAYVTITVRSNGKEYTMRADLRGERQSAKYTLNPGSTITFTNALINFETSLPLEIRNTGAIDISFESLAFSDPDFYALNPPAPGQVLTAGTGSFTLQVAFKPTTNRPYSANLQVNCKSGDCPVPILIQLDGSTEVAASALIYIPSFDQVEPTAKNFEIPIFVRLSDPSTVIPSIGYKAVIEYNATVFNAERLSSGTISADSILDKRRITTIEGTWACLGAGDTVLTNIIGSVLLGETDTTSIKITNFEWTANRERVSLTRTDSGKLVVSICRAKDPRLVRNNGIGNTVLVNPNPAGQKVNVHATCLETGEYTFELINLVGQSVAWHVQRVETEGQHVFDFQFDADELPDGMYYLIMKSPARVKTTQVYILK